MDSNNTDWISIQHIQNLFSKAALSSDAQNEVLTTLGISKKQLSDSELTVPVEKVEELLEKWGEALPGMPLGLMLATQSQPANFGVIGYLSQSCLTLSEALNMLTQYNGVLSNIGEISVSFSPGCVQINWQCARANSPLFYQYASEYIIASLTLFARSLTTKDSKNIHSIDFAFAQPKKLSSLALYENFFHCPINFNQTQAALRIDAKLLNSTLLYSDNAMKKVLEEHARRLLDERKNKLSVSEKVKKQLQHYSGTEFPDKETLAQAMGMSGRSLHRKLEQENTSFQCLLDETRLDLAKQQLELNQNSLENIAIYLGFQSRQSFIRWFKKQTGFTPGEFRGKENLNAKSERFFNS